MYSLRSIVTHIATQLVSDRKPPQTAALPASQDWTIARGSAGWSLLFHAMDDAFPNQGWNTHADNALAQTLFFLEAEDTVSPVPLGLFTGLAGVCLHISWLARDRKDYYPLHIRLDVLLFQRVLQAYQCDDARLENGVTFWDYDVINGLAGIGSYALGRQDDSQARSVLAMIIERFLFLSQWSDRTRGHLRFFIPPHCAPHTTFRENYPEGATDLGFAHGLPGPLAFLSLAWLHGVRQAGLREAIEQLGHWLYTYRLEAPGGVCWPAAVPQNLQLPAAGRPAWCYGTAGVAWALWLAGQALQDNCWQACAIQAMETVSHEIVVEHKLTSPMLCHGIAGVLQIAQGFAMRTAHPLFAPMQSHLLQQIVTMFHPAAPYGFGEQLQARTPLTPGEFLEGVPGIALALLTAYTSDTTRNPLLPFFLLTDDEPVPLVSDAQEKEETW
jgi:hypothetical protein